MSDTAQVVGTARDFDFWMGSWSVHNRVLRERPRGSGKWDEFAATVVARPILDGLGNEDEFRTGHGGGFAGDTGVFEGPDTFEGRPILVRFVWSGVTTQAPRWEQAFSEDEGATWETNWTMDFTRREATR